MKCRKHDWSALFQRPATLDQALTFTFRDYGRYVRCNHCGLLGYVIRSRRSGIRVLSTYGQESVNAKADAWNLEVQEAKRAKAQEENN